MPNQMPMSHKRSKQSDDPPMMTIHWSVVHTSLTDHNINTLIYPIYLGSVISQYSNIACIFGDSELYTKVFPPWIIKKGGTWPPSPKHEAEISPKHDVKLSTKTWRQIIHENMTSNFPRKHDVKFSTKTWRQIIPKRPDVPSPSVSLNVRNINLTVVR